MGWADPENPVKSTKTLKKWVGNWVGMILKNKMHIKNNGFQVKRDLT